MLINISTTHYPATDLGYLLHKHPDRLQTIELSVGRAHIFYPEKSEAKTTICILLDIDPIGMVKSARNSSGEDFALGHYVNDRPYVASSFMSVALAKAFSYTMKGKCNDRPELVDVKLPFEVKISVLPAPKGGEILIRKLFEPLGYNVELTRHVLDDNFLEWGESKYYTVTLKNIITAKDLISHLYVLIPTLDNYKHYFISGDEIEKLLQRGQGWLNDHPEKEQIVRRYLINLNSLSRRALERLTEEDEVIEDVIEFSENSEELKRKESLHEKRLNIVVAKLIETGSKKVLDLGCGEGKLIKLLLKQKQFTEIAGMDVSYRELVKCKQRLRFDEMAPAQKNRITLFQGSLTYRDKRLEGFDAAAIVEVIEHLELNRLNAFERVVFEFAKPKVIVLTTPNKEYNVLFEKMSPEDKRHEDHRFEWTREEFANWTASVCKNFNYNVKLFPVGDEEPGVGTPSQMAVFTYGN